MNSQFLIWLGDIEYKQYKYTLVFGRSLIFKGFISNYIMDTLSILVNFRVVEGLAKLQEVSRVRSMQVNFDQYTKLFLDKIIISQLGKKIIVGNRIHQEHVVLLHLIFSTNIQDSEANWRLKRVVRVIDCGQL